ncbi:MAG: hypothetical protein ACLTA5_06775 [Anaerococcus obesiensis]
MIFEDKYFVLDEKFYENDEIKKKKKLSLKMQINKENFNRLIV